MKHIESVVMALIHNEARMATKFVGPKEIVRATRVLIGKKIDKRNNIDIRLVIGRPNYSERKFVKDCQKANEKFPVKKIQLRFPPKKKKAA